MRKGGQREALAQSKAHWAQSPGEQLRVSSCTAQTWHLITLRTNCEVQDAKETLSQPTIHPY